MQDHQTQQHPDSLQQQTPIPPSARRWNWGWSIATVYTVFALATIAWAVFSFSQRVELVSNDYYAKEIEFDTHAAQVRNEQAMSVSVQGTYDQNNHQYTLTFPHPPSTGTVQFYRPSGSEMDRNIPLNCPASGELSISTAGMKPGLWRVLVQWQADGREFYKEFRQVL